MWNNAVLQKPLHFHPFLRPLKSEPSKGSETKWPWYKIQYASATESNGLYVGCNVLFCNMSYLPFILFVLTYFRVFFKEIGFYSY